MDSEEAAFLPSGAESLGVFLLTGAGPNFNDDNACTGDSCAESHTLTLDAPIPPDPAAPLTVEGDGRLVLSGDDFASETNSEKGTPPACTAPQTEEAQAETKQEGKVISASQRADPHDCDEQNKDCAGQKPAPPLGESKTDSKSTPKTLPDSR